MNVDDKPTNYVDRFSKKILSDQNLLQDLLISPVNSGRVGFLRSGQFSETSAENWTWHDYGIEGVVKATLHKSEKYTKHRSTLSK